MGRAVTHAGANRFNEAAGADPADAGARSMWRGPWACRFNEAAGADPADAPGGIGRMIVDILRLQ